MPTIFSKCTECFYLKTSPLDSDLNKYYKKDYDRMKVLQECGLPIEIASKIIEMTKNYYECDFCDDSVLCDAHRERSYRYASSWPDIKCDKCCWNDYT